MMNFKLFILLVTYQFTFKFSRGIENIKSLGSNHVQVSLKTKDNITNFERDKVVLTDTGL